MRRFVTTVLAALLAACGSSTPTDGNTPPPPPASTPASVVVMAGDGQQAEPGTPVALAPSVIVKDAAGAPVSGAVVTFAVDSGGGSVTGATVTTGSNGSATVGSWTLGPAEGRNVLKATVTSLAPVRIAATAQVTGSTFPATTIGGGGGSITISQPGPLNGFKLDVPGGAFPGGLTATVSYATSANIPRTPTMNPVSPLITISTNNTDLSVSPITIHIDALIPANTFPVIMVYDASSGATEVLSTTAWDANGVTASAMTLSAGRLLDGNAGSLRARGASLQENGVSVFVDAMPDDVLMRDYDSGFRPGVDDWEFQATPTVLVQSTGLTNPLGTAASALWYFIKKPSPVKLNGRFMLQPGVPLSDRVGIRWAAVLGNEYDGRAGNAVASALINKSGYAVGVYQQNQFMLMRAKFARGAEDGGTPRPQLIAGNTAPDPGDDGGEAQYLIAYRVSGDRIYVADAFWPGDATRSLQFSSGSGMTPYTGAGRAHTATLVNAAVVGLSTLMPLDQLPVTYAQVLDGSIGKAVFPTDQLHGWDGRLYDTLFVVDTLRVWDECAGCPYGFSTALSPAPAAHVASGHFYRLDDPVHLLGAFPTGGFLFTAAQVSGPDIPIGNAVGAAFASQQVFLEDKRYSWVDWHPFTLRKLQTSIAPSAPTGIINTPLSLTHQVTLSLLPSSVTYRWDFGDQTPKVLVHNVNSVNHTYTAAGIYPATAEILDDRNNQVIGRSTAVVTIAPPNYNWKIQSATVISEVYPPGGITTSKGDQDAKQFVDGLLANLPANGNIKILPFPLTGTPTCLGAVLYAPTPTTTGVSDFKTIFGTDCIAPPDYTGTLSIGTFGSGNVTGKAVEVHFGGDGSSINATMADNVLTGTFVWQVHYYTTGSAYYTVSFRAVQVASP